MIVQYSLEVVSSDPDPFQQLNSYYVFVTCGLFIIIVIGCLFFKDCRAL